MHCFWAHHLSPDATFRVPKEKCYKEKDPIDEDIPTLDIQRGGYKGVSPVMFSEQDPVIMPSEYKIFEDQAESPYCWSVRSIASIASVWAYNKTRLLCRKSPADGGIQAIVPQRNQTEVVSKAHYPKVAGRSAVRKVYDTLKRQYYCIHMPMKVCTFVSQCESCRRHWPS